MMQTIFYYIGIATLVVVMEGVVLIHNPTPALAGYYDYNDTILVINDNSATSTTIGNYFKVARNIPDPNVVHIKTTTSEYISRADFIKEIQLPLEVYLTNNGLTDSINYIVLTKDIPLSIGDDGTQNVASPDSELIMILGTRSKLIGNGGTFVSGSVPNPYYKANVPFSRKQYGIYLVTRLDGYTVEQVKSLIDRSAREKTTSSGNFVLDVDPNKDIQASDPEYTLQNTQMRVAAKKLLAKGFPVILDETKTFLTGQKNVLGYWSWGSNDCCSTHHAVPGNTYANGAIGDTGVSTSARTFTFPPRYGQSLIADLIAEGISGVKGYSSEPYTIALSHADILFDRYTSGFNMADSFYAASQKIGWRDIVVGDPKMVIVKSLDVSGSKDFVDISQKTSASSPAPHSVSCPGSKKESLPEGIIGIFWGVGVRSPEEIVRLACNALKY